MDSRIIYSLDKYTVIFNMVETGLNKGMELTTHDGYEAQTRTLDKDEVIELIKYLIDTL